MDRKLIWTEKASGELSFRRWKIVYTIRRDAIIIGRVWPAAMGEADMETPL
jgi:hypothetical protein